MPRVRHDPQRLTDKDLLALSLSDALPCPNLRSVALVPFEARAASEALEDVVCHLLCIYHTISIRWQEGRGSIEGRANGV